MNLLFNLIVNDRASHKLKIHSLCVNLFPFESSSLIALGTDKSLKNIQIIIIIIIFFFLKNYSQKLSVEYLFTGELLRNIKDFYIKYKKRLFYIILFVSQTNLNI